jgi:2-polyprenyl-6-hydroxyphenyl methylase/3-demethylubiquinone-9 3-methyltransferase
MIDNDLYNRMADTWWSDNGFLNLLQSTINPWRVFYFKRILTQLHIDPRATRVLDVGCGGGLLAEEIAALGFPVTGIDPSSRSLDVARVHARESGLRIDYHLGDGAKLEFDAASFQVAFCCDTLEHIHDWDAVIAEIARVLVRGAVFFYDTINRTFASKIRSIKMAQEWKWTRYAPPNTHVWEMFITPAELEASLSAHGFQPQDLVGTAPKGNPLQAILLTRQYKAGRISGTELGKRIAMIEGKVLSGSYMGYALKQ